MQSGQTSQWLQRSALATNLSQEHSHFVIAQWSQCTTLTYIIMSTPLIHRTSVTVIISKMPIILLY